VATSPPGPPYITSHNFWMGPATDTENRTAGTTGNQEAPSTELRGAWHFAARTAWTFVVLLTAALFIASIPAHFEALHSACSVDPCAGGQLSPGDMRALDDLGLSIDLYAAYVLALDLVVALGFCVVGAVIFWRRSRERGALFASFALVMFGLTWPAVYDSAQLNSTWGGLAGFLVELGLASLLVLLLVFPDGRFVPRWTRWVVALALVHLTSYVFFPDSLFANYPRRSTSRLFSASGPFAYSRRSTGTGGYRGRSNANRPSGWCSVSRLWS
jgi:hypothetical protein